MPPVIGLSGRAGSGKSTAARLLRDRIGRDCTTIAFARPIKAMLRAYYASVGLDDLEIDRRLHGDLKTVPCPHLQGRTPRHAMQTLGTEWGRGMIGETLWIDAAKTAAQKALARGHAVLIDDVRFPDELEAVRDLGGVVLGIDRPDLAEGSDPHVSEAGVTPDAFIRNSGSEADLSEKLSVAVSRVITKT